MIQRLTSVLAAIALIAGSYGIARASFWSVSIVNDTPTCAIVTVWEQIGNAGFVVVGNGPRHLRSRMEFELPTSGSAKTNVTSVRVRAEMKQHADCTGATVEDLDQRESAARSSAEYTEAALFKTKVGYRIRFLAK